MIKDADGGTGARSFALALVGLCLTLATTAPAAERVVLCEEFTNRW